MLREEFELDMLAPFSIIVEGPTDEEYVLRAVELFHKEDGVDLLQVPKALARQNGERIGVSTPGRPGAPHRGGTAQLVRLAEALRPYVFTLEIFSGLIFVFDHDHEGLRAQDQLEGWGFRKGQNTISLDPRHHPTACASKQVTIEDLLSLSLQREFFDLGNSWCHAEYEQGVLKRFKWGHQSKADLCDFVCRNGSVTDLEEVGRIVRRSRQIFGFPDPPTRSVTLP